MHDEVSAAHRDGQQVMMVPSKQQAHVPTWRREAHGKAVGALPREWKAGAGGGHIDMNIDLGSLECWMLRMRHVDGPICCMRMSLAFAHMQLCS